MLKHTKEVKRRFSQSRLYFYMLLWGNPLFHFTSLSVFEEQEFQCVETAYILSGCDTFVVFIIVTAPVQLVPVS